MIRDVEPKTAKEKKIAAAEKALNDAMNAYALVLTESWETDGQTPMGATMFASRQIVASAAIYAATTFLSLARLEGENLNDPGTRPEIMRLMHLVFDQVGTRVEKKLPDLIEVIMAADNCERAADAALRSRSH